MQVKDLQLKRVLRTALLVLLLNVVGMGKMYAQSFTVGDLNYTVNNDGVSVTLTSHVNGQSATGTLTIPDSVVYEGTYYSVSTIGRYAFSGCSGLIGDLIIPNSVTTIEDGYIGIGSAFYNCTGFTGSLIIPNSMTSIGDWAFLGCSGFTGNLTIGNSVTSIGWAAFDGCIGFTGSLIIPNSVTTIGDWAFLGCSGFTGDLIIGNSVTTIGDFAFQNSGFKGNLTIGNSVTTIGEYAFSFLDGCPNGFTGDLIIPNSVTTIGRGAFNGSGFTGFLTISNSITSIDEYVFYNCNGFTGSLIIPNTVSTIGIRAFSNCSGFTGDLTIPNSVTTIGSLAFENCNGFNGSLTIPNSVTTIDLGAFRNCNGFIGSLTIPNSVTTIGSEAFSGCSGFNGSLTIGDSVIEIGGGAFGNCSGFTGSLAIPNSVTEIGGGAFVNCSGFTGNLTIGNSVTSIGDRAFKGCTGFTGNLIMGNSVILIDNNAFLGCSGFTGSLTIPDSVILIGYGAFSGCSGFTGSLTIGNSVTSIGSMAFENCSGFTDSLTIPNSVTDLGGGAFSGCIGFTGSLTISNSIASIGGLTFYHCSGFTGSLTIPNSVVTIGNSAFSGCCGFTGSLTIGNSVDSIGMFAFNGCSGFSFITSLAEIPPILSDYTVFNPTSWNMNTPVYVPCGCEEAYSAASWGRFSNFYGMCECVVTLMANPDSGGIVTGDGIFEVGQICTVTATANEGYVFAIWTQDGVAVSTDAEYTFYVTNDMELVAHFVQDANIVFADSNVKSICVSSWDANGDGELNYAEAASVTSIGNYFQNNTQITSFDELQYFIGLSTIGNQVFNNCRGLTSIVLPNSVITIGDYAFSRCNGITGNLAIPNSVTAIGNYAFLECSGFTGDLVIPASVTTIGHSAFAYCSGFTGDLVIPDSVTVISNFAFGGCSGFNGSLVIPNTVSIISESAFDGCSGFTGCLTIPNSVTFIGDFAFMDCSGFTGNMTIPNSVTSIGNYAFKGCTGLTGSFTIPNSVTSIGYYAFAVCSNLSEIIMLRVTPPLIEFGAFDMEVDMGKSNFEEIEYPIYVPYESLNAYKTAENWSDYEDRIFPMTYNVVSGYGESEGNYRFIASPLVEDTDPTTVNNMITETAYDLYEFNQSATDGEWQNYKANGFNLTNGQGYLYANAEEVNVIFKGNFNEDDTKEVSLVYDANSEYAGWNLVGNPFPVCAYANKSYYTMNEDGTGVEPVAVSSTIAISACTGVMVEAEEIGESVIFSKTAPEMAANQGNLQVAVAENTLNRDGIATVSTTLLDKVIVSFNMGDQLEKFVFNKGNANLSIPQGDKDFAIAYSEKQGEMPLDFKAAKNGSYTLSVNAEDAELEYLHLIDNLTGADVDLLATPSYTFEAKTTDYASRFRLVFICGDAEGDNGGDDEVFAFVCNGEIILTDIGADAAHASLQVMDVLGHICRDVMIASPNHRISTAGMTPGVYVLRLIYGDNVKTQKIVID